MSTQPSPHSPSKHSPRKPRVAVVFGGRSSEHGVSVVTAASVLRAIDRTKYDVLPIGITADGRWALTADEPERMAITGRTLPNVESVTDHEGAVALSLDPGSREVVYSEAGSVPKALGEVDVVFPMLHGPYGEDGTIQGLLDLSGTPYVGSGVLASAVGMDKEYMKRVFTSFGLPVGPYTVIRPREWDGDGAAAVHARVADFAAEHGWPVFVKPARAGSSVGISKVGSAGELAEALEEARRHDPKVMVEALLRGREIECGVLEFPEGPRASVPAEIPPPPDHAFYDFDAKYIDSAEGVVPAPLTPEQTARVQELAVQAFEALSCEGLARADFFLLDSGEFVINEVNTMPGFTPISMYPRMWQESGVSYPELVDHLIQAALRRSTGLR
jgi:D-alanine-D-alanine ligase